MHLLSFHYATAAPQGPVCRRESSKGSPTTIVYAEVTCKFCLKECAGWPGFGIAAMYGRKETATHLETARQVAILQLDRTKNEAQQEKKRAAESLWRYRRACELARVQEEELG